MGGVYSGDGIRMATFLSQFRTPLEDHCSTGAVVGLCGSVPFQEIYQLELSKFSSFLRSVLAKSISWRSLLIFQILTPCGFRAAVAGALEVVQALLEASVKSLGLK